MTLRRSIGVALLAASLSPAAAHAAGETASFSIRPGHYDASDPASRAYFKRIVPVGGSFSDDVVVSNSGRSPVTLLVYPVDGLTGQTSGSVYANRSVPRRETGAWLRVGASRITVVPGGTSVVQFRARVPAGAAPGDHLAGIAFEDADVSTSGGSFRVRQILREVVGVLITVPGPAQPRVRLGRVALRTLPGTNLGSVVVAIGNAGRRLCKPQLAVTLASHGRVETIKRRLDTILPGDRIAYPLVLRHDLRPATYQVRAHAACPPSVASTSEAVILGAPLHGESSRSLVRNATVVHVTKSGTPVWMVAGLAAAAALIGAAVGWLLRQRRKPV